MARPVCSPTSMVPRHSGRVLVFPFMESLAQDRRPPRWARWLELAVSSGVCLLLFSIWTEGEPRWHSWIRVPIGLVCLGLGVYVFFTGHGKKRN